MEKFWLFFAIVLVAEIPCMVRTAALQMQTEGILPVVFGTLAGSVAALVVGIAVATLIKGGVPEGHAEALQYVSGAVLVAFGLFMMFKGAR
jgi:hypothetical protein